MCHTLQVLFLKRYWKKRQIYLKWVLIQAEHLQFQKAIKLRAASCRNKKPIKRARCCAYECTAQGAARLMKTKANSWGNLPTELRGEYLYARSGCDIVLDDPLEKGCARLEARFIRIDCARSKDNKALSLMKDDSCNKKMHTIRNSVLPWQQCIWKQKWSTLVELLYPLGYTPES